IGLDLPRQALYARIAARVDAMLAAGLVDEVRGLIAAGYGCELPAMSGIGYRQVCAHLRGDMTLDAAVTEIKTETHRLARMQHTWFRRDDPRIRWLDASAPDLDVDALAAVGASA
ncbi:MAG: tRNA (adenosine(37)-N6)-dimethylallyltransferase MiaA, partial [Dehalococcoidia bacterium]